MSNTKKEKQIYIFGAGDNGKALLAVLRRSGKANIAGFIDNYIKEKEVNGIECINLEEAIRRGGQNDTVLISPDQSAEIKKQLVKNHFDKVYCVSEWIRNRRYFVPQVFEDTDYRYAVPFNHYESPYVDIKQIHENEDDIFDCKKEILNIDFNVDEQLELLQKMIDLELPNWENGTNGTGCRYYYLNSWFGKGSADALGYMMQVIKPRNIIEIGSGFSTAVMLDVNERFMKNRIRITSIEPRAGRLKKLIKPSDNLEIYEKDLQEIPTNFFDKLEENDILFIDSSHVSKIGSDVNYLLFEVLPRLKKGIYIHFHDVFYPFIYPAQWIYEGRVYNETYMLRAFLMDNRNYSIQLFGDMLEKRCIEKIPVKLRGCGCGSLWIKKK